MCKAKQKKPKKKLKTIARTKQHLRKSQESKEHLERKIETDCKNSFFHCCCYCFNCSQSTWVDFSKKGKEKQLYYNFKPKTMLIPWLTNIEQFLFNLWKLKF